MASGNPDSSRSKEQHALKTVTTHAFQPPQPLQCRIYPIVICHPAWPDGHDGFLHLIATDNFPEGSAHFGTVWLAAAIVAGNTFNGFLSRSKDPSEAPVECALDDLLEHGRYWFHVPTPEGQSTPYNYPVCCQFEDWMYPHGRIPEWWPHKDVLQERGVIPSSPHTSRTSRLTKGDCSISGYSSGTKTAYMIPLKENGWFTKNCMQQYVWGSIEQRANTMPMRADLRVVFDQGCFAFVPKRGQFVIHFLEVLHDVLPLYNNCQLGGTDRVSGHCLLARFAWSVFQSVIIPAGCSPRRVWKGGRVQESGRMSTAWKHVR